MAVSNSQADNLNREYKSAAEVWRQLTGASSILNTNSQKNICSAKPTLVTKNIILKDAIAHCNFYKGEILRRMFLALPRELIVSEDRAVLSSYSVIESS